jgi:ParB/RepB/Spo0J family partition protein
MEIKPNPSGQTSESDESSFLRVLPVNCLFPCPILLRQVRKDSLEYHQLRESILNEGILQPLLVRPCPRGYEAVDGAHRLAVAIDIRLPSLPCMIRDVTDTQVLRMQIEANEVRCPSSMIDLSNRLHKIVKIEREMNVNQLAHSLSRSPSWVRNVLGLMKLTPASREALEVGAVSLESAIELSKLPASEQVLGSAEEIRARVRRMRSSRCQSSQSKWEGVPPAFRTYKDVCREFESPVCAGSVLISAGASTAIDGWNAAISWVLQMDKKTFQKRVDSMNKRLQ